VADTDAEHSPGTGSEDHTGMGAEDCPATGAEHVTCTGAGTITWTDDAPTGLDSVDKSTDSIVEGISSLFDP